MDFDQSLLKIRRKMWYYRYEYFENIIEIGGKDEEIWDKTQNKAGSNKDFLDEYYDNRVFAVAYQLINIVKYEYPKELLDYGIKTAPQSFVYV